MNEAGQLIEEFSYEPWGRKRNPNNWTNYTAVTVSNITERGYTLHEHLNDFALINMNGRVYDPLLGRMLSVDNFVQQPDNTQSYNRYSYCQNNPLIYTDPSGESAVGAVVAGVIIGVYLGGVMANGGEYMPPNWNYKNNQTWEYMICGGIVGGLSAGVGSAIAGSGVVGANTLAIAGSSLVNSLGTSAYTGNENVSVSLGVVSYNFTNNDWGYLGKKGNSTMENIGYGLGALANLGDFVNIIDNYTNWEGKLENKCNDYMDNWTQKNPDAVVNSKSVGGNAGRSYPSYFGKNPYYYMRDLNGVLIKKDYMGMVDNWSWKEYAGYLHDAEYIAKGINSGAKYLMASNYTWGADLRLLARTLYLGLKHKSLFEIGVGAGLGGLNTAKIGYGWFIGKP